MVPAVSHGIPPVPRYSGSPLAQIAFRIRGYHPLRPAFPGRFSYAFLRRVRILQPRARLDARGLGSSPFAHHYLGNHCCFLLLRVLRCFSSPGSPPFRDNPFGLGCPIRTSADRRPSAPPRGFSQLVTSFFASKSQGIPRTLLVTYSLLSLDCLFSLFSPEPDLSACFRCVLLVSSILSKNVARRFHPADPVENNGFEPLTLCVQGRCSSQLS